MNNINSADPKFMPNANFNEVYLRAYIQEQQRILQLKQQQQQQQQQPQLTQKVVSPAPQQKQTPAMNSFQVTQPLPQNGNYYSKPASNYPVAGYPPQMNGFGSPPPTQAAVNNYCSRPDTNLLQQALMQQHQQKAQNAQLQQQMDAFLLQQKEAQQRLQQQKLKQQEDEYARQQMLHQLLLKQQEEYKKKQSSVGQSQFFGTAFQNNATPASSGVQPQLVQNGQHQPSVPWTNNSDVMDVNNNTNGQRQRPCDLPTNSTATLKSLLSKPSASNNPHRATTSSGPSPQDSSPCLQFQLGAGYTLCVGETTTPPGDSIGLCAKRKASTCSAPSPDISAKKLRADEMNDKEGTSCFSAPPLSTVAVKKEADDECRTNGNRARKVVEITPRELCAMQVFLTQMHSGHKDEPAIKEEPQDVHTTEDDDEIEVIGTFRGGEKQKAESASGKEQSLEMQGVKASEMEVLNSGRVDFGCQQTEHGIAEPGDASATLYGDSQEPLNASIQVTPTPMEGVGSSTSTIGGMSAMALPSYCIEEAGCSSSVVKSYADNVDAHNYLMPTPLPVADRVSTSTSIDTEEESFVDVVGGVEGVPNSTRQQRKAHIEFYRKIKSFRNREKNLECQMCQESVVNTEASIRSHVHSHSESPLYICKMCQFGYKEQHSIFEHISEAHPGKDQQFFEDKRDMHMLGEILMSCFPRCGPKNKSAYTEMLEKLVKMAVEKGADRLSCQMCGKEVPSKRGSIIKHLHIHPCYRCKKCKFTSSEEFEQLKHCRVEHNTKEPDATDKSGDSGYNVSMALEVLSGTLKKCFFTHYCSS